MKYIKFSNSNYGKQPAEASVKKKFLMSFLSFIFPVANPDFEKKYNNVKEWLLEFDDLNEPPSRELGLDKNGVVIVKAPFKKNIGMWVDSDMYYDRFKSFSPEGSSHEAFQYYWDQLN